MSYGVTDSYQAASLEELCSIADAALFRAKREGRDRVITDPDPATGGAPLFAPT